MAFVRKRQLDATLPQKNHFLMKVVIFALVCFGILWGYVSSTGNIEIVPGNYSVSAGDSAYSMVRKFKITVADWRYKMYLKFFAPSVKLQTGTYAVGSGTTIETLFSKILSSPPSSKEVNITFLPGWTVYDIEAALLQYGLVGNGELTKPSKELFTNLKKKYSFLESTSGSLEWFMYPDTYRFRADSSTEAIISRFLDNFSKKISSKYSDLSGRELYKTLILASIVEKEERNDDNRPVVAGILLKRVNEKMFLGADATICYPYGILYRECTPAFIVEHLEDDTPYNTRKHIGLPPTPITSPTFSSFQAAKNPEATSYYYYLHDNDGVIHYGTTLQEHNRNKAQYLGR